MNSDPWWKSSESTSAPPSGYSGYYSQAIGLRVSLLPQTSNKTMQTNEYRFLYCN